MQKHLERQAGVQKAEVSLLTGKVEITPKEDGRIDPNELMKATYDSGVTVAEMDMVARGLVEKDPSGGIVLAIEPSESVAIVPNDLSAKLQPLAGTGRHVTVRGMLYQKPAGKAKQKPPKVLKLTILEVQGTE